MTHPFQDIADKAATRISNLKFIRENGASQLLKMWVAASTKGELLMVSNGEIGSVDVCIRPIASKGFRPLTGPKSFVNLQATRWGRLNEVVALSLGVEVMTYSAALSLAIAHTETVLADVQEVIG